MEELRVGDIVCLNSHAEQFMTVESFLDNGEITCVFFDKDDNLYRDSLPRECISFIKRLVE
jgi:hypothetical protein